EAANKKAIQKVEREIVALAKRPLYEVRERAFKIAQKEHKKAVQEAIEKSGATGFVVKELSDLLVKVEKLTGEKLHQELIKRRAKELAIEGAEVLSVKELKKALGKAEVKALKQQTKALKLFSCSKKDWCGKNGIGRQLEKDIIADVQERFLACSGKAKGEWIELMDDIAKRYQLDENLVRALKEGGEEGIEKGIREGVETPLRRAIRRGLKEGVKRAKEARKIRYKRRFSLGLGANKKDLKKAGYDIKAGVIELNGTSFTHEQLSEFKYCGYDRDQEISLAIKEMSNRRKAVIYERQRNIVAKNKRFDKALNWRKPE
ncbi:MAG: hypothetical protein KDD56_08290, partial [Bdellovibrionales bacterium]|nr:hypothetical protein [Bdellovibrionales bacterium]